MNLADDPQMLGAYLQNLVRAIWHAEFLHPDLLLCIIKVKNVWSYTYNPPTLLHGLDWDNFTFFHAWAWEVDFFQFGRTNLTF